VTPGPSPQEADDRRPAAHHPTGRRPAAQLPGKDAHPPRRRPDRLRRALLIAVALGGLALIADGVLTIVWQEPVTAWRAAKAQDELRDDLAELSRALTRTSPRLTPMPQTPQARIRHMASELRRTRRPGQALGRLEIPLLGLDTVFVSGVGDDDLKKGPGHYPTTALPGQYGTAGIAGHRTTYGAPFRHIDRLRPGSRIIVHMPYGTFTYRVTHKRITTPEDTSSLQPRAGQQRLVLTACHPLYSAAERIVVSARLVSSRPATAAA